MSEFDNDSLLDEIGDTEPVTFTSTRTAGNQTVETDAWVYEMEAHEAESSAGVYVSADAIILLRRSDLDSVGGAKPADTVALQDGTLYTLLSVQRLKFGGPWKCTGRNLTLANDLQSLGTLSRPTNAQDTAGRATLASYTDVATNIPCRVQPEGGTAATVLERKTIPQRFTAFLGVQVDAHAKDKFVADGVTYTVLEVQKPQRITDLMNLTLEEVL